MDDEWGLSMEELDSLENNAKRQLAERQRSSASASVPPPPGNPFPAAAHNNSRQSTFSSPLERQTPPSPSISSGRIPTFSVKFFLDQPGRIAVQTVFNKHLVAALKMVPGHEWDASRRVWMYPQNRYEELINRMVAISELNIDKSLWMQGLVNSKECPEARHIQVLLRRLQLCLRSPEDLCFEATPPLSLPSCVAQLRRQTGSNTVQHSSPRKHAQHITIEYPELVEGDISSSPIQLQACTASPQKSPMKGKGSSLVVQIYMMDPDHVAARSAYNEKVKEACQSVPGRAWNAEERVWMVPLNKMDELVQALLNIPVTVEAIPPLKITASSSIRSDEQRSSQPDKQPAASSPLPMPQLVNLPKHSVKLLLHSSGQIAAKFEYNQKIVAAIKAVPRAEWNPRERLWLFPSSSLSDAEKALSNIGDLAVNVEGLEPLVLRAMEATAATPDLQGKYSEIPGQIESQLLPFQRDGVRFALQHGGRALIADEMGLGKTLQAIAVASCLENEWPVLIVVPSSLRLQWAASLQQWLDVRPSDITVVMSQCTGSNREGFNVVHSAGKSPVKLDGLFNIVSYDLVTKLSQAISEAQFKIIIADEAHYLKNAQAKRTNACVPLLQKAKHALLLTGTPALSRPIELFKQLEALQPMVYRNIHEYGNRYCLGGNFGLYQGSSNLQELHALVKSTVMIRRLKKDVLSELPLKRRQQVFVSLEDKGIREMRSLFNELEGIKHSIKRCSEDEFEKLKYAEKQVLNKIYTESAVVKLPAVQDYLTTIIEKNIFISGGIQFMHAEEVMPEADCKCLIFAYHQTMLDGIEDLLMKKKVGHIRIDGGTPQSTRQALVTRFQENDKVRAAVLGIRAAGVGLTLTAASTVIFAEMSWTPGDLVQAEDRAHRIGQASSVNVYYLHAHDTIDDIIWDTVQNKLENLGQVLDGQENTLQVASAPKIHVSLPRGQGTLHSFLQSGGPIHRPCDGKSHSGTLTSGPDTGSKSSGLSSQHEPSPREEGLLMNFGGGSNWKQMEESLKREFIDEYDELDISSEDKRRKLF